MNNLNYRAIEIISGNNCNCVLSKHTGKRMLYSEVLELLTSSHSTSTCSCTFKYYEDRRDIGERRKFDIDNLTSNLHNRSRPYGRRVVNIHNRARDRRGFTRYSKTIQSSQTGGLNETLPRRI